MPFTKGKGKAVREKNFDEFRHGKTYAHTAQKYGKKHAQAQMIAAVLSNERRSIASINRAKR